MKVLLDASEIADQLAECEVGDKKVIEFTVTKKSDGQIDGDATSADYAEDPDGEEYEEPTDAEPKSKSKVPKAILLVSAK